MKRIQKLATGVGFGLISLVFFITLTSYQKPNVDEFIYGSYEIPTAVIIGQKINSAEFLVQHEVEEDALLEDWMFDISHYED